MSQARPDYSKIHEAVKNGEQEEVERLLGTTAIDEHYYDANGNSAASVALKCGNDAIYKFLVSRGIRVGPHEQINEYDDGQPSPKEMKLFESVRNIHRRFLKVPNLKHLQKLISCSKLCHEASDSQRREHVRCIAEAFEDLNSVELLLPILKVASTSPNLKIAFDFNRTSVEFMDPTKHRGVLGASYPVSGYTYVGAKDLMSSDGNRNEALGVLIHELTHFAIHLIYNNDAKPYQQDDVGQA